MYFVKFVFVALVFRASFCLEEEPKCYSKFDWEEKLLEKTIKTELLMQEYVKTMNNAMESITGLKAEFKEMRANLDPAIGDYRAIIDHQNQQIADYIKQPTIAFNVRDAKDFSPQRHDIIRFSTVLLNLGGAYDETTGIFTSPVNGTFIFSIQIATHVIRWGIFQLVVDNSSKIILSITHYNADANYSSTSGTVAHVLTEGQMVWLQFQYDSGSTQRLGEHADYASNQFSGVLVHKNVN